MDVPVGVTNVILSAIVGALVTEVPVDVVRLGDILTVGALALPVPVIKQVRYSGSEIEEVAAIAGALAAEVPAVIAAKGILPIRAMSAL